MLRDLHLSVLTQIIIIIIIIIIKKLVLTLPVPHLSNEFRAAQDDQGKYFSLMHDRGLLQ